MLAIRSVPRPSPGCFVTTIYIGTLHIQNKLCTLGFDVTCPVHDNCTSTLTAYENLSEFDIGKDNGKQFGSQNVVVRYIVTYGDARSAEGVCCRNAM